MLHKHKSHVMYQLIAGIKYPRKQAGILSCRITLIAPGLQSHRGTVCFNFYWVYLPAPSPLSPSALTLWPAPNSSSLTCYQTTFLALFIPESVFARRTNPFCIAGEGSSTPRLFLCPPQTASVPAHSCCYMAKVSDHSQPLLQMESLLFVMQSHSATGGGREAVSSLLIQ